MKLGQNQHPVLCLEYLVVTSVFPDAKFPFAHFAFLLWVVRVGGMGKAKRLTAVQHWTFSCLSLS